MRAILLAAGIGSRLRPITDTIPKCLVPINGHPLLDIWFENLSRAGVGPFLVNTHYLAEQVKAHVASGPYRDQVTLVHEPELLGTAGTLIANLDFFQGEDGMLIHADNYCLCDFQAFIRAHQCRPPECVMTMMTFRTDDPSSCGIVELDERGVVVGFHEKVQNPTGNLANGAVYVLSADLLKVLKSSKEPTQDFSTQVIPEHIGSISTFQTHGVFLDIGTPEAYRLANKLTFAAISGPES